jgi:hypothetical protein
VADLNTAPGSAAISALADEPAWHPRLMVEPEWAESIRSEFGIPTSFVLYLTPGGWRYALYSADGVMDGRLDLPVDANELDAQRTLFTMVERGVGRALNANWESTQPDSWTAQVNTP